MEKTSEAKAIMRYFDDLENGSPRPTMAEMKELIADKASYKELAKLASIELGVELETKTS